MLKYLVLFSGLQVGVTLLGLICTNCLSAQEIVESSEDLVLVPVLAYHFAEGIQEETGRKGYGYQPPGYSYDRTGRYKKDILKDSKKYVVHKWKWGWETPTCWETGIEFHDDEPEDLTKKEHKQYKKDVKRFKKRCKKAWKRRQKKRKKYYKKKQKKGHRDHPCGENGCHEVDGWNGWQWWKPGKKTFDHGHYGWGKKSLDYGHYGWGKKTFDHGNYGWGSDWK